MTSDRFDHLETNDLPHEIKTAICAIARFDHLEIGEFLTPTRSVSESGPSPQAGSGSAGAGLESGAIEGAPRGSESVAQPMGPSGNLVDRLPCVHCGQMNERGRETCWACYRFVQFKAKTPVPEPQEIVVVLDGVTYKWGDPNLPEDIRALMEAIRKEGYSTELLARWRSWRATRHVPNPPGKPLQEGARGGTVRAQTPGSVDIKVFQGQRVSVIRLDGKVYTSDDPNLPEEFRQLFAYIDRNGVTPALMEFLRQFGKKVKYRPNTTADPSDGDLAFWREVQTGGGPLRGGSVGAGRAAGQTGDTLAAIQNLEVRHAQGELVRARRHYETARSQVAVAVIGLIALLGYVAFSFLFR